jgi:hypothetical protein
MGQVAQDGELVTPTLGLGRVIAAPPRTPTTQLTQPHHVPNRGLRPERRADSAGDAADDVLVKAGRFPPTPSDRRRWRVRSICHFRWSAGGAPGRIRTCATARGPVKHLIGGAFQRPSWASCSRLVSLVATGVLWFVPRDIPRRASSMDSFEALMSQSGVVLCAPPPRSSGSGCPASARADHARVSVPSEVLSVPPQIGRNEQCGAAALAFTPDLSVSSCQATCRPRIAV